MLKDHRYIDLQPSALYTEISPESFDFFLIRNHVADVLPGNSITTFPKCSSGCIFVASSMFPAFLFPHQIYNRIWATKGQVVSQVMANCNSGVQRGSV